MDAEQFILLSNKTDVENFPHLARHVYGQNAGLSDQFFRRKFERLKELAQVQQWDFNADRAIQSRKDEPKIRAEQRMAQIFHGHAMGIRRTGGEFLLGFQDPGVRRDFMSAAFEQPDHYHYKRLIGTATPEVRAAWEQCIDRWTQFPDDAWERAEVPAEQWWDGRVLHVMVDRWSDFEKLRALCDEGGAFEQAVEQQMKSGDPAP
jgi:hypothetical protein